MNMTTLNTPPEKKSDGAADLLTLIQKLPVQTTPEGQAIIDKLVAQAAKAMDALMNLLQGEDRALKARAEFALHGITLYVTRPGAADARRLVVGLMVTHLSALKDPELRKLLISQLQLCGDDAAVPVLGKCLCQRQVHGPAVSALTSIGTAKAVAAMAGKMGTAKGRQRIALMQALGRCKAAQHAGLLVPLATSEDRDTAEAALWSLARMGAPAGITPLVAAAKKGKGFEQDLACQWSLQLARALAGKGDRAKALSLCQAIKSIAISARKRPLSRAANAAVEWIESL